MINTESPSLDVGSMKTYRVLLQRDKISMREVHVTSDTPLDGDKIFTMEELANCIDVTNDDSWEAVGESVSMPYLHIPADESLGEGITTLTAKASNVLYLDGKLVPMLQSNSEAKPT